MKFIGKINHFRIRQWISFVWRFSTLNVAKSLSKNATPGFILSRRFGRYQIHLDISRSSAQAMLYLEGSRFVAERKLITSLLKPGMTAVDVGANIGYYLLLLRGEVGKKGRVICFEPDQDNLKELKLNVSKNRFNNVEIVAAAVGKEVGTANLSPGLNAHIATGGTISVPLVTLDSAFNERVDLIKIDVEGYEGHVLAGAANLIEKYRPTLFIEMHPHLIEGYTQEQIIFDLKSKYPILDYYANKKPVGLMEKFKYRYFSDNQIIHLKDEKLDDYLCGKLTYWIVCKNK